MHRQEDNIKIDYRKIRCEDVGWFELAQDRVKWLFLVNTIMNSHIPYK
jgi:hypothetical protein